MKGSHLFDFYHVKCQSIRTISHRAFWSGRYHAGATVGTFYNATPLRRGNRPKTFNNGVQRSCPKDISLTV